MTCQVEVTRAVEPPTAWDCIGLRRGPRRYGATVACAPGETSSAQGQRPKRENQPQDAAGEAAGAASLAAGLAMSPAAGLASGEAATGLASAEASGAGVSSDLVQAMAAKNI